MSQAADQNALQTAIERRPVLDEFHALYQKRRGRAPEEKRFEELTATIRGWYEHLAPHEGAVAYGTSCAIQIKPRSMKARWRSIAAVIKVIGIAKYKAAATLTFDALAGLVGNTAAEALQVKDQTGTRKLESVATAPATGQI
jgi:hypothetical protein